MWRDQPLWWGHPKRNPLLVIVHLRVFLYMLVMKATFIPVLGEQSWIPDHSQAYLSRWHHMEWHHPLPTGPLSVPPYSEWTRYDLQNWVQTYHPNNELGAELYCSSPLAWEDLPMRVEPSNQCNLVCDHMLVAVRLFGSARSHILGVNRFYYSKKWLCIIFHHNIILKSYYLRFELLPWKWAWAMKSCLCIYVLC